MRVRMENWNIPITQTLVFGYEGDNKAATFYLDTDLSEEYNLKVDVELEGQKNIIQLARGEGGVYSVELTKDVLSKEGFYSAQIRGTLGEVVRHSNIFYFRVNNSINATDPFPPVLPTEFTQMEKRLTSLNDNPPKATDTGFWEIYNPSTGVYEPSRIPLPEGKEGPQGPKGPNGADGADGKAATIQVGTVTEGETASVTNSGTENAAIFDFVIPKASNGAGKLFISVTPSTEPLPPEAPPEYSRLDSDTDYAAIDTAVKKGIFPIMVLKSEREDVYIPLVSASGSGFNFVYSEAGFTATIMFPPPESGVDYPVMIEAPFELDENLALKGITTFEVLEGSLIRPKEGRSLQFGEKAYVDETGLCLANWQADLPFFKISSAISIGRTIKEIEGRPNKTALISPNTQNKYIAIQKTLCPEPNICVLIKSISADGILSQESGILFTSGTETKTFEDLTLQIIDIRTYYNIKIDNAGDKTYILTFVADEIEPILPN